MREIAKQELIGFFIQQQQQASVGPSAENLISGGSGQVPPNLMLAQIRASRCDNPPKKIPYYRLKPIHFGHLSNSKLSSCH
jgi:hypothetical protein